MRFLLILSAFIILLPLTSSSQKSYQVGEKLRYVGSYYSSGAWSDIVEIRLEVHKTSKPEVVRLVGTAQTYVNWDDFFKIRDTYQTWIETESGKPLLFKRSILEGKFSMNLKYAFKYKSKQIVSTVSKQKKAATTKNLNLQSNIYDMLSALYLIRNMNLKALKPNDKKTLKLLIDEKYEFVTITFMGTEQIKVDGMGISNCYKMRMQLQNQSIIKNNPNNIFWLTADQYKIPVFIKAEIPVGSIQIKYIK